MVWPTEEVVTSLVDDDGSAVPDNERAEFVNSYYSKIGSVLAVAVFPNVQPPVD